MLSPCSPFKAVSMSSVSINQYILYFPLDQYKQSVVTSVSRHPETMDELSFKEGELIMLKTRVGRQWLRGKLVSGQEGIFPRNYVEIVVSGATPLLHVQVYVCLSVCRRTCQRMQLRRCLLLHRARTPQIYSMSSQLFTLPSLSEFSCLPAHLLTFLLPFLPSSSSLLSLPSPRPPFFQYSGPHCVAVYDFTADGPDELNLRVGDSIELIATVGSDWLRGRLGGQEGIFPKDFVEIKEDLPAEGKTEGLSKALFDFDGQTGELSFKVCMYYTHM